MTFLSRKNSSESKDASNAGGKSPPPGPDEGKPSLLHRLSKITSKSEHSPNRKESPQLHPVRTEDRAGQEHATGHSANNSPPPNVVESHLAQNRPAVKIETKKTPAHSPIDSSPHRHVLTPTRSAIETHGHSQPGPTSPVRSESHANARSDPHKDHRVNGLTKHDVQHLFHGAPHFTLEKGRRGRFFPQAFFPWDNDLEVSDLQDRRYLRHESFTLATLHAHLPVPDEASWASGIAAQVKKDGLETGKRPMFELGIYERPNMLSQEAREPGTVGMRYFLERPVADGLQDEKVREHGKDVEYEVALANTAAVEAFKMLAISKENDELNAKVGKHAPPQDRAKLIREGPHAWKSVGVRDINMKTLVERLQLIDSWRDHVVNAGWKATLLDKMPLSELHAHLFGELLYPPRKLTSDTRHEKAALKVQIEALVKVLTTPGAWVDLSIPEGRLRFGKILHSRTTRYDSTTGTMHIDPERKWLLIQLLLSIELVIRLDAALRLGIAMHTENFQISGEEIHHFNKLRNLKVDWDLVAARRYLMLSYAKKIEPRHPHPDPSSPSPASPPGSPPDHLSHLKRQSTDHHGGFFGSLRHTLGLDADVSEPDACDVAIFSRQPRVMLEGLIRFATNIGWPRASEIQERLSQKLCQATPEEREKFLMDSMSCSDQLERVNSPPSPAQRPASSPQVSLTPTLENFCVDLHAASPSTIGGWLSHTWLSGLIMPGDSSCDILMCTLLENDTDPATLNDLGTTNRLPLHSAGFILNGSSWWSKSSIIGRVMAPWPGSKECMGWISLPNYVPLYEATLERVSTRWVKVKTFPVVTTRERPRIFDGDKLAMESTPLGQGVGGVMGSEFSMLTDHVLDDQADSAPVVRVEAIGLHLSRTNASKTSKTAPDHALSSWVAFDLTVTTHHPSTPHSGDRTTVSTRQVRYGLDRDVSFVTVFPCRLPHGHVTFKPGSSDDHFVQQHPHHRAAEHLPAHPLHKSYKYVTKTLAEIVENPHLEPPASDGPGATREVWIIDARHALTHRDCTSQQEQQHDHDREKGSSGPTEAAATATGNTPATDCNTCLEPQIRNKDILVRAWCAEKGRDAIIARVGKTCLSCAIREARALEIGIIVRIGVKE